MNPFDALMVNRTPANKLAYARTQRAKTPRVARPTRPVGNDDPAQRPHQQAASALVVSLYPGELDAFYGCHVIKPLLQLKHFEAVDFYREASDE